MNEQQLARIRDEDGFVAALDQSGGSTPKALRLYGVSEDEYSNDAEMFDRIPEMRTRIVTSPSFGGDRIMGAILFENTMDPTSRASPRRRTCGTPRASCRSSRSTRASRRRPMGFR